VVAQVLRRRLHGLIIDEGRGGEGGAGPPIGEAGPWLFVCY
jgi:hypothetical protein